MSFISFFGSCSSAARAQAPSKVRASRLSSLGRASLDAADLITQAPDKSVVFLTWYRGVHAKTYARQLPCCGSHLSAPFGWSCRQTTISQSCTLLLMERSPEEIKALLLELRELSRLQTKTLEDWSYLGIPAERNAEYEKRRVRLGQICEIVTAYKPEP